MFKSFYTPISIFAVVSIHAVVTGVGTFLFESRLGLLSKEGNAEKDIFIEAVTEVWETTEILQSVPLSLSFLFRKQWRQHEEAWKVLLKQGDLDNSETMK